MVDNLIWLRGEIVRESEAHVNVLSPMAQFGLNAFEGIRCYWNEERGELYAFRLVEHLDRLRQSCQLLRLELPYTHEELTTWMGEAIAANDFQTDVAVRMTVFVDGQGSWHSSDPISMFIAPMAKSRTNMEKIPSYKACISSWQRINDNALPPRAKVGANYINGRYALLQAKQDGYDLPIFLGSDGKVSEGAGACLFMVYNGKLITPTTTSSILESITRNTIIELAQEQGIEVSERAIDRTELYLADEAFLCGSAAELSPLTSIDGHKLGQGIPGPLTTNLLQAYHDVVSGQDEIGHSDWRSMVYRRP